MDTITEKASLKPFVKWAGGKRQLLGEIRNYLPLDVSSRCYFEPFAGAGALLFNLQPERAVINDLNSELTLAYRVIRDHVDELIAALGKHRNLHCREHYYETRALAIPDTDKSTVSLDPCCEIEKTARFIYLNKTCYNGLYRVNSSGYFNVPLGRHKNLNICEESLLRAISLYLNTADITILNTDFEEAVSGANSSSFVYFDPPYHSSVKSGFNAYQAGGFDESEQIRLRNLVLSLTRRKIPCLLSNADTPFIRDLYHDKAFAITGVTARRAINSDQKGRGKVNEVLIMNWRKN